MTEGWFTFDSAALLMLGVNGLIGLSSVAVSIRYVTASRVRYYAGLLAFWAAVLLIPAVSNLGVAWLLIEGTTAASAMLVAHSGQQRALEAGWKYLVLTTAGLTVALLGILYLDAAITATGQHVSSQLSLLDWRVIQGAAPHIPAATVGLATVLIIAGLASKVGWAPVHHWLPDAHSEAPAPVSALLSASLLPTVMLVAWRAQQALAGGGRSTLLLALGLLSLAVATPFLLKPLPVKRLLAYSSLEHMGVLALGLAFGNPLALLGAAIHVGGHAAAKALGFYATIPIFRAQPAASHRPATGIAYADRGAAVSLGVSLAVLGGLPPGPLFLSELMILAGGIVARQYLATGVAAVLLAIGLAGITHQAIEILLGRHAAAGAAEEAAA